MVNRHRDSFGVWLDFIIIFCFILILGFILCFVITIIIIYLSFRLLFWSEFNYVYNIYLYIKWIMCLIRGIISLVIHPFFFPVSIKSDFSFSFCHLRCSFLSSLVPTGFLKASLRKSVLNSVTAFVS